MLRTATLMRVVMKTIRRMEWGSLSGRVAMSIRVAIRMLSAVISRCYKGVKGVL